MAAGRHLGAVVALCCFTFFLTKTKIMKLFSLVASALGLAYAAEDVADVADIPDVADAGWQDASDADVRTWKNDVLHAQGTLKDIKNKQCKLPKGQSLHKLGNPKNVRAKVNTGRPNDP